jgi:hypothetical protein
MPGGTQSGAVRAVAAARGGAPLVGRTGRLRRAGFGAMLAGFGAGRGGGRFAGAIGGRGFARARAAALRRAGR